MARRIEYPTDDFPNAWVDLPDTWQGLHAERRDNAARQGNMGTTLTGFAVSLALADDWSLPGLNGNPENWNFEEIDLRLIAWLNQVVVGDFAKCFIVPKASPSPLRDG